MTILAKIFANPHLPEIDDYYEPFTFDYEHLQIGARTADGAGRAAAVARSPASRWRRSNGARTGRKFSAANSTSARKDYNFEAVQKDIYGQFENTFMMYLPRLCEHCLNPSCVASCPSGSIYKREEDGIVLIDQDKCRGWRMCVSGCPYKKIYYNWTSGKAEKCIFCYPRIEAGQPTVCSETCVGRIRYLGVLLYDADGIEQAASVEDEQDLYEAQLELFLDPNDPAVEAQARADGIADNWIEAAKRSPAYKMAVDWKIAFPLHPEYRTLPMVWYVPPLSPIQSHANAGAIDDDGRDSRCPFSLRIPVRYLANLLTAGAEAPDRHGARAHACHAHLFPPAPAWRGRRAVRVWIRPGSLSRKSRTCTAIWRSPIMRIASSSRPAIARRGRRLWAEGAHAASPSAMAAISARRTRRCSAARWVAASSPPYGRWTREEAGNAGIQSLQRAAFLSFGGDAARRCRRSPKSSGQAPLVSPRERRTF